MTSKPQYSVSAAYQFDVDQFVDQRSSVFKTDPVTLGGATGITEISASIGSAYQGASRTSRELRSYMPSSLSADAAMLPAKDLLDARAKDQERSNPLIAQAVQMYRTGVAGNKYILDADPNGALLGWSDEVVEAVQEELEDLFEIYAHSDRCYLDVAAKKDFTDIIQMAAGSIVTTGEFFATFEFEPSSKFHTKVNVIDTDRLSNPNNGQDTQTLRKGILKTPKGRAIAYYVQTTHPSDYYMGAAGRTEWKRVDAEKPWGRPMVIHIHEQLFADQSRGAGRIVSILKQLKMTENFADVALQNAVLHAMISATLETKRDPFEVYQQLGMTDMPDAQGMSEMMGAYADAYLNEMVSYGKTGNEPRIDGARIPALYPGTTLNIKPVGNDTLGTDFFDAMINLLASGLNVSAQELSKNMKGMTFAGMKAAMAQTVQQMESVKRSIADKVATVIYRNFVEEVVARGMVKSLPPECRDPRWIMDGFNLDALSKCSWIGAAKTTIDEYNEVRSAKIRYDMGITTMSHECARLGLDWRKVQKQRRRENAYLGGPIGQAPLTSPVQNDSTEARISELEDAAQDARNDQ